MPDKIFVAMKVPRQGDGQREQLARQLAAWIAHVGYEPFIAYQEIQRQDNPSPQVFMPFVRQAMRTCRLAIILYHPALRGGLIEAGLAYAEGIPIWVAHTTGEQVSSSLLGCAERVLAYRRPVDLQEQLSEALRSLSPIETTSINRKEPSA